jgi:hypothetical protein
MSESTTKLHQKDYTPEVNALLTETISLAEVRFPGFTPKFPY